MKTYMILHRPTGLFYKPASGRKKRNLVLKGKVYRKKPSLKYVKPYVADHKGKKLVYVDGDWEIVQYESQPSFTTTLISQKVRELYIEFPEFGDLSLREADILVEEFWDNSSTLVYTNKEERFKQFREFIKERLAWFNGGKK